MKGEEVEGEKVGGTPSRKTKTGLRNSMRKRGWLPSPSCPPGDQWDWAPLSSSSMTALSLYPSLLATPASYPAHCRHVCVHVGVCRPVCTCAHAHTCNTHTHAYTYSLIHSWPCGQSPRSFKVNQCIFCCCCSFQVFDSQGLAKSQQFIAYTPSWEQRIFGRLQKIPKFILSWNISSDSWLPVFHLL